MSRPGCWNGAILAHYIGGNCNFGTISFPFFDKRKRRGENALVCLNDWVSRIQPGYRDYTAHHISVRKRSLARSFSLIGKTCEPKTR